MTPGDPAVANAWGTNLNDGISISDLVGGGVLSLSVAGNSNVTLTNTPGAVGQSLNAHFNFTGVLTGNILVLWPQGAGRMFSVTNSTTGAFTLTLCANNGSGAAGGTTVVIPQGITALCYSDGTNVVLRQAGFIGTQPGGIAFGGQVSTNTGGFLDTSSDGYTTIGFGITASFSVSSINCSSASPASFSIVARTNGVILNDGATSWVGISKRSLKKNFQDIPDPLAILKKLRGGVVLAHYLTDNDSAKLRPFVCFEEMKEAWPYAAHVIPAQTIKDPKTGKTKEVPEQCGVSLEQCVPLILAIADALASKVEALEARKP